MKLMDTEGYLNKKCTMEKNLHQLNSWRKDYRIYLLV